MSPELDETFRLVLMEAGNKGLMAVAREVRTVHPDASTSELGALWSKYMGFDGRVRPTHDYMTGGPLR